eukprot:COSAG01_NODE_7266_length_3276_cov_2.619767_2_plen_253_part_00
MGRLPAVAWLVAQPTGPRRRLLDDACSTPPARRRSSAARGSISREKLPCCLPKPADCDGHPARPVPPSRGAFARRPTSAEGTARPQNTPSVSDVTPALLPLPHCDARQPHQAVAAGHGCRQLPRPLAPLHARCRAPPPLCRSALLMRSEIDHLAASSDQPESVSDQGHTQSVHTGSSPLGRCDAMQHVWRNRQARQPACQLRRCIMRAVISPYMPGQAASCRGRSPLVGSRGSASSSHSSIYRRGHLDGMRN